MVSLISASDISELLIVKSGIASLPQTTDDESSVTVSHDLGYKPFVMAQIDYEDSSFLLPTFTAYSVGGSPMDKNVYYYIGEITTTYFKIFRIQIPAVTDGGTTIKWSCLQLTSS